MTKIISVFLFIVLSFPLSMKYGIWIYFKLNQDKITARFCENKDKPEMECEGQCHLKKELKKVEDIESKTNNTTFPIEKIFQTEIPVFLLYEKTIHNPLQTLQIESTIQTIIYFVHNYAFQFCQENFHPPRITSYSFFQKMLC